ncbi:DUF2971 domain-containing protein [Sphingomonas mollis]|uniref:DUF2971 domain-containing protein n=1 Tax=Sphingomonas mollis TaxID=2795726 RepID=A0ABS0XQK3_9SPHN|nr:DUF2971 domain-containing protein [Sphingomonas sp. BT553]MBJ6122312.1 DUF2971 domain-containing protein [Sphingomonas sp. BT553]
MSLIDLLTNRRLALTRTAHWADRNDHLALAEYGQRMGSKQVYAVCLTEASETFHHWQIFAGGQTGVCVAFDKEKLVAATEPHHLAASVRYLRFDQAREHRISELNELPFLKRAGFSDEKEFRIIALSDDETKDAIDCHIPVEAITRITFSPLVPPALVSATKSALLKIDGCEHLTIGQSLLTNNPQWLRYLRKLQLAA